MQIGDLWAVLGTIALFAVLALCVKGSEKL
jgi:hypothetical protein